MGEHDLPIRLKQRKWRRRIAFVPRCTQVNQIGKLRRRHLESSLRERLLRRPHDAVVGEHRVRDHLHVALRHVASDTIVGRTLFLTRHQRERAALFGMAGQAALAGIVRSFRCNRVCMRGVTSDAAQLTFAAAITLAQTHREIMFEQVILWWRLWSKWNHKNAEGVVERGARMKIAVVFAGPQNSGIPSLVAAHADVVSKPAAELCGINDCLCTCGRDVCFTRAMTVLTPDSQLTKRELTKFAVPFRHGLWTPAMTQDAARQDWTTEAVVGVLIARRQRPTIDIRVKGERCLEQIIVALHDSAKAICACSNDPIEFMGIAE